MNQYSLSETHGPIKGPSFGGKDNDTFMHL
jgi:hypothetical protein